MTFICKSCFADATNDFLINNRILGSYQNVQQFYKQMYDKCNQPTDEDFELFGFNYNGNDDSSKVTRCIHCSKKIKPKATRL